MTLAPRARPSGRTLETLRSIQAAAVFPPAAIIYPNEHEDAGETRNAVEREGRRCLTISGDVRDPQFCKEAVQHVVDELGGLDILVNNAAFQEHVMSLEELTDEHLDMTSGPTSTGTCTWPAPRSRT